MRPTLAVTAAATAIVLSSCAPAKPQDPTCVYPPGSYGLLGSVAIARQGCSIAPGIAPPPSPYAQPPIILVPAQ